MSMFPHGKTITVVRRTEKPYDENGDPAGLEWRFTIDGCGWAPRSQGAGPSSGEVAQRGRQGVLTGLTVYAPHGSDIRFTDQLELPGHDDDDGIPVLWEVDGEAGSWENPFTGWQAGMEIAIRRAAG